jgi:hypothetical protein
MPATTAAGNAILDLYLRGVAITAPTRVWLGLHTADPGAAGTANEVSTGAWPAYARQDPAAAAAIATGFNASASKATTNAKELLFPEHNGGADITITHVTINSALTAGVPTLVGQLVTPKVIQPGDQLKFKIGEVDWNVV